MLTPRTASSDDNDQFANYLSSQMGAGGVAGSDDDDSDEDASYLSQDIQGSARSQANGAGGGFDVSAVSSPPLTTCSTRPYTHRMHSSRRVAQAASAHLARRT